MAIGRAAIGRRLSDRTEADPRSPRACLCLSGHHPATVWNQRPAPTSVQAGEMGHSGRSVRVDASRPDHNKLIGMKASARPLRTAAGAGPTCIVSSPRVATRCTRPCASGSATSWSDDRRRTWAEARRLLLAGTEMNDNCLGGSRCDCCRSQSLAPVTKGGHHGPRRRVEPHR